MRDIDWQRTEGESITVRQRILGERSIIHCVPKKWRQNSNNYNYGISYRN